MSTPDNLKAILASIFSLAAQSQLAHWNVTGPRFVSLHKLFGDIYEECFDQTDTIAEYLRSRDTKDFAPGGLSTLARLSKIREMVSTPLSEEKYISNLIGAHDTIIVFLKTAGDQAGKENDTDTQNFLNELSTSAKKRRWMLVSSQ